MVDLHDKMLADRLVEMQVLSRYQAQQLEGGRTKFNLGPYIITDSIGQGGMGHVFKAVHNVMGRVCAVKVLPLSKATPEAVKNFRREVRTQAQLDHPHLVHAYDAGEDGAVHYLVVEYVPGADLRRLVRSQGALPVHQAASVIMQAALGLDYAHQRGLIHRDVKPGNILVTPAGEAKVSDLGLAGFIHEAENDPRAGKIVGTADYLSPEQIRSPRDITALSDIYSLGCTLYYAVTGKVPFPGGNAASKAKRHCEEAPWHPRRFNADIPEEFVEVVADMMEKVPQERISTMAEVALRLEPWAETASTLVSRHMTRSRWAPPPLPTGGDEGMSDTGDGVVFEPADSGPGASGSISQMSQGTSPVASAGQETRQDTAPPPLVDLPVASFVQPLRMEKRRGHTIASALAVAVPIAVLYGFVIGFLAHMLLW